MSRIYRAWGACLRCDYEGTLEFTTIEGESYEVEEDEMVMLQQHCPACGNDDNSLFPFSYFIEIRDESEAEELPQ